MDRVPGHLTKNYQEAVSSLVWTKIVGIGNAGTGKTCLIKHFCESKYMYRRESRGAESLQSEFNSGYQPTVGVDYGFRIQAVSGTDMRVHIWDLSGSPEYAEVRNELYSGTDAIFITFDVTNTASFEDLEFWIREANRYATGNPEIVIVGNKADLKQKRTVPTTEGKTFSQQHKLQYFETSALTGEGVDDMFQQLLTTVHEKRKMARPGGTSSKCSR